MDPQHLQATLDLILGQLGTVTQQIRNTQTDLADFRRHTNDRLDNIERNGNPAIYTPSRPHSPYGEDNRPDHEPHRDPGRFPDHYQRNPRPPQEPIREDNIWRDNDTQLLKNIRIDAPTYDGTLDPQVFLDWLKSMDSYFKWYNISEARKVRFAEMKLIGRANLYWTNLENMREARGEHPITDWRTMKQELKRKYLPPSYYPKLLDKWNRLTQGSKPVKDYISAFDDFLIRCNGEESATPTQILSMFRAGLREDLRTELFARGVDSLEAACSLVLDLEDSRTHSQARHFDSRSNSYRTLPGQSQTRPSGSTANRTPASLAPPRTDLKGKAPERDAPKPNSGTKCYRCHGYGHIASQCSSPYKVTIIEEVDEEEEEPETDLVHQVDEEEDSFTEEEPVTLQVVRCALAQPKLSDDRRRTSIFHTFIKIGEKSCKVIIDSGSCINAVSSAMISKLNLKVTPHPNPYKVSWINSTTIEIKDRSLIPMEFVGYQDKIWCDVLTMDVGQIILGRPWLFDNDVHIYGRMNTCVFEHSGKKIKLMPSQPKPPKTEAKPVSAKHSKGLHLLTAKEVETEITQGAPMYALVAREVDEDQKEPIPDTVRPLIENFADVFPEDFPNQLPPLRDI
ncbi:uncharacterized protein LOC110110733 [Dendrobium catenatum]|uniref:uncharacterized protein LOC110110733 n=1 Tax=Dendrobium catenatum TaxID=906689 RepID=UPI00109FDDC1|nr:uncharacterized protein LOC110110733 [Dendrobium catenatum]